jgi:adenosylcobinamide-GDP ribazoletransferase
MRTLRAAISTFTVVPVGRVEIRERDGERLLFWLPFIGAALGTVGGLVFVGVVSINDRAGLLAAILAGATVALLTRGLHLDGLADTVDGLGSRAPAEEALEIMRRSDIGPFGVVSIVVVIGIDVAALTMFADKWHVLAALALAAATGRLAVVHSALPGIRSARPGGFGSLVAGSVRPVIAAGATLVVLLLGVALAEATGANPLTWLGIQLGALALLCGLRRHVTRRLGGVTGDVFGALIEVGTALTLIGLALAT